MTQLPVSVVVVSRDRPEALHRCLIGLSQLQYNPFEIIVVADTAGCNAARDTAFSDALKIEEFNDANISAARNAGIVLAAGDIIAFIDDDAVPEPTWLSNLTVPITQGAHSSGGYVRARNGISYQWRARTVDAQGHAHHADPDSLPTARRRRHKDGRDEHGRSPGHARGTRRV